MDNLNLAPRRRERLGDQLYGQILEQIVSGTLNEGDKLPSENQICQAFGVSRPTVREAIMRLHADGLVTTRQGSGTFVQKRPSDHLMRLAKVSDIAGMLRCQEVRIALEGQSARLAALRRTQREMEGIGTALEALRLALNGSGAPADADYAFHLAVARASGNHMFADILEMLNETVQHSMTVALGITRTGSKDRARRVVEEHEAIAEAIERGDGEAADLTMRYHLHRSRQRMTDGQRDL
jgi:GntR family transcriptional repressor for pyruvate dehydrogenase complex